MKLLKMLILMMLLTPSFSYAQGHSGAGGGDATASDFQDYINKIDAYLLTPEGMSAFPEIKQPEFHNVVMQVKPVVKDERVFDSFGVAQTCVSHVQTANRYFQCDLQRLPKIELNNQPTFYHLTLHELLFQNGMELPVSKEVPSNFSISSRLELRLETFQAWVPGKSVPHNYDLEHVQCEGNLNSVHSVNFKRLIVNVFPNHETFTTELSYPNGNGAYLGQGSHYYSYGTDLNPRYKFNPIATVIRQSNGGNGQNDLARTLKVFNRLVDFEVLNYSNTSDSVGVLDGDVGQGGITLKCRTTILSKETMKALYLYNLGLSKRRPVSFTEAEAKEDYDSFNKHHLESEYFVMPRGW